MSNILKVVVSACAMLASVACVVGAQTPSGNGPAPRRLPAPTITSPRFAGSAASVIPLPNGMLLINDVRNHRVMLSDSMMRVTTVVIDSGEYGARQASIMRYPGDSVVFVEAVTPSMTIIDPAGKIVRNMAVPNPRDAGWLLPSPSNMAAVDARGRFVHRGLAPRVELPKIKPNEIRVRTYPDSNPVIRDNPVTHAGDTLTWIKSIAIGGTEVARADGRSMVYMRGMPVEIIDEWAVLSNGSLAVLRGRDYHIELIDMDGKVTVLPRMPYPWERLSDEAKVAVIDSVTREREESLKRPPMSLSGGGTGGVGGGAGGAAPSRSDFPPPPPGALTIKPEELPDYRAPFLLGAMRADAEGHAWIKTQQRIEGDTTQVVYDVVNDGGKIVDRVSFPKDRAILGWDKRGNVFLVGRADGGIQWIERVRWRD